MPSPPKFHLHRSVLFVTLSIEEGLFLLPNPLCQAMVKSCLARAQALHPATICHFIVESTHVHLIMVVDNPDDVPGFLGRFKTESAHMINRLLGRPKRTVWCDGYDSPVVLTPLRTLIAIAYLYANPAQDGLAESIKEYPGLSSWKMFRRGIHTRKWKHLRRPVFQHLPRDAQNFRGYSREASRVLKSSKSSHTFCLKPNAWMEVFGITDPDEQREINERLVTRIELLEKRARITRRGRTPMGRERLLNQRLDKYYQPERTGQRSWCLSEDRALCREFIADMKARMELAAEVYQRWKMGDFSDPYPLGLYPPSMPKLAEPLEDW